MPAYLYLNCKAANEPPSYSTKGAAWPCQPPPQCWLCRKQSRVQPYHATKSNRLEWLSLAGAVDNQCSTIVLDGAVQLYLMALQGGGMYLLWRMSERVKCTLICEVECAHLPV